ncbi:hypothetical protein BDF20DRAFT_869103 [Mycotypha africana]|uniref:uncharacterized protein n=1 Tax=Mycotypha africana TaxID=64632 RepID=UPI0023000633|nr:uncharacterized protein BDF20DRAFT_869103 [Mycotypha africana]KAI8979359.1 hypothetical protein BDF20DRAFT_869103 [Mycotypha africana]
MIKNKEKGGKPKNNIVKNKPELIYKYEGQEYAQFTRLLSNGRYKAHCSDGVERMAHIPGQLRNRTLVNPGDFVLLSFVNFKITRPISFIVILSMKQEL